MPFAQRGSHIGRERDAMHKPVAVVGVKTLGSNQQRRSLAFRRIRLFGLDPTSQVVKKNICGLIEALDHLQPA